MEFDLNAADIKLAKGYIESARPLEEMFSVRGKVAIVTGAGAGLGFNIALRLLQGGAKVILADCNADRIAYCPDLLREAGFSDKQMKFCRMDVTREEDVAALVGTAVDTFGTLDIYINSAAVWSYAHIYDLSAEEFRRVIDTNLTGAFLGIKHASRYMVDNGIQGKITLITSNSAWLPYPVFGGYPHYCASKGGANSLVIEAAKELKRYGIMVNAVAPGGMVTPGSSTNLCAADLDEDKADVFYEELMAWQNDGQQPVDTVAIVAYAMSTAMSDGITGEVVVADAGMSHNIFKYLAAMDQYPEE